MRAKAKFTFHYLLNTQSIDHIGENKVSELLGQTKLVNSPVQLEVFWKTFNQHASGGAHIVGNSFRSTTAKRIAADRKTGMTALLVREPNNPVDPCAVSVWGAAVDKDTLSGYRWVHLGYVQSALAKPMVNVWPTIDGKSLILNASFIRDPSTTRLAVEAPREFNARA